MKKSVAGLLIIGALALLFIAAVLSTGCASLFNRSQVSMENQYPPDIAEQCVVARVAARAGIERVDGKLLLVRYGQGVVKHPGERQVNGMWVWYEPRLQQEIGGMTEMALIIVGCNPVTGGDVNNGVLIHENGHFYLIMKDNDPSHNPKYDNVFDNWSRFDK